MTRPKVALRKNKIDDAERFCEILNSMDKKYWPHPVPKDVEAEKQFLREQIKRINSGKEWGFTVIYNAQVVGVTGCMIDPSQGHIVRGGYFIDPAFQGKGIATAAFEKLAEIVFKNNKIKRIETQIFAGNTVSIRVVQKLGFSYEGTLQKSWKHHNRYHDMVVYAKVR